MTPISFNVRRIVDAATGSAAAWFLSPEITRRTLDRERARANRTGEHLSLLTFKSSELLVEPFPWNKLARRIRERLRNTDEAGWLEEGRRIGILLPATPASGAWKLADDIIH